jgi:hypothetical protein
VLPPLELLELALPPLELPELVPPPPELPELAPLLPDPDPPFDGETPELLPFSAPPELEAAAPELELAALPPPFELPFPFPLLPDDVPGAALHPCAAMPVKTRTARSKRWRIGKDPRTQANDKRDANRVPSRAQCVVGR